MKNEKITEAWDSCLPDDEAKARMLGNIQKKYSQGKKHPTFKPAKIIASAAAIALIVGLVNIQTVIAFIGGLFFVPGVGLTEDAAITAVSIGEPLDIATDRGIFTLRFMSKIAREGKNDLVFNVCARSALMYDLDVYVSVGGNKIEAQFLHGGGGSGPGGSESNYNYIVKDFPDVTEFDFTIRGQTQHISLTEQGGAFVSLSKENNGITLALHKFPKLTTMLGVDICPTGGKNDYSIFISLNSNYSRFYDVNGDEIAITGAQGGMNDGFDVINMGDNAMEVKGLKSSAIELQYARNLEKAFAYFELPIPEDGETVETDLCVMVSGHAYIISEVSRLGDVIFYKDNADYGEAANLAGIDPERYREAVKNRESRISMAWLVMGDFETNPKNSNQKFDNSAKTITGFDPGAKTLELGLMILNVVQFGDFDIEFD